MKSQLQDFQEIPSRFFQMETNRYTETILLQETRDNKSDYLTQLVFVTPFKPWHFQIKGVEDWRYSVFCASQD